MRSSKYKEIFKKVVGGGRELFYNQAILYGYPPKRKENSSLKRFLCPVFCTLYTITEMLKQESPLPDEWIKNACYTYAR